MLFVELNRVSCRTYLLGCEDSRRALLIDPLRDRVDRYLAMLAYHGYRLEYAIDTHTHADHLSGVWDLRELTGARIVMHKLAPAPGVDIHASDGQRLTCGQIVLEFLHTPGHTPDSMSIHVGNRLFTGDTLLIHGTGRADFAGGDAGVQYDSIVGKLFTLPDATIVLPAHDYRGHWSSTIGAERRGNPRLAGRTRAGYVELMNALGLPLPEKIQEALQANQSAIEDGSVKFPSLAQLSGVRQIDSDDLWRMLEEGNNPIVVDVREPEEFGGDLGHVPSSQLIPLRELVPRADELEHAKQDEIVVVCRAGIRSTTAAAILTGLGFERVSNLKGGMLDWNERGLPVER